MLFGWLKPREYLLDSLTRARRQRSSEASGVIKAAAPRGLSDTLANLKKVYSVFRDTITVGGDVELIGYPCREGERRTSG